MKVLILLALVVSALSCGTPTGSCSARCTISNADVGSPYAAFIAGHEGCCSCTYIDTTGHPTIGVGYLLEPSRAGALKAVGANYEDVVSGRASLSIEQISKLFKSSLDAAHNGAKAIFPEFAKFTTNVQMALVDMTYNLGEGGLNEFTTLKSDLAAGNYAGAASAAQDSLWCRQVGSRCTQDTNLIRGGASGAHKTAAKKSTKKAASKPARKAVSKPVKKAAPKPAKKAAPKRVHKAASKPAHKARSGHRDAMFLAFF